MGPYFYRATKKKKKSTDPIGYDVYAGHTDLRTLDKPVINHYLIVGA